jgi:hypothetical protein
MRDQWLEERVSQWLPAYLNGTLDAVRGRLLRHWLSRSPELRARLRSLERVERALVSQSLSLPPEGSYRLIMARARALDPAPRRPQLAPLLALQLTSFAIAIVLILWAMPPGIVLQWSVEGQEPALFEVYRAEASEADNVMNPAYQLLRKLPATSERDTYSILDTGPTVGHDYVYRVVALGSSGELMASQTIVTRGNQALYGQLVTALLLAATVLLVALWYKRWQASKTPSGLRLA